MSVEKLTCPKCGEKIKARIVDSRLVDQVITRRRECERCGTVIITQEIIQSYHAKKKWRRHQ